jgi:hypothetical protein
MKATVSWTVLYIFQFAAMKGVRLIGYNSDSNRKPRTGTANRELQTANNRKP